MESIPFPRGQACPHCTRGRGSYPGPPGRPNGYSYPGFPGDSVLKNPLANAGDAGDAGSAPESGRSPGEGNDSPLQYSCLGNPVDTEAWRARVYEVPESDTT